jgi:CubicO group peptidase (beta-lactamase class C family)
MKRLLVIPFLLLLACNQQPEKNKRAELMDQFLTGQMEHFRFNGNVLVAENGEVIFQKSYGFADFDTKRLLNDSSVFELASVSKQFTATAILLLKDKGKLQLTDSLRQYFPELPYSNITIWHMLTHTSGLPDYEEAMNNKWDRSKVAFNKDMIAFLANEKPAVLFAPGTRWTYSNTAYAILASIVEKISGQTFKDFLAVNIFKPLDMQHSRIYNTRRSLKDTIPNYAYGYGYSDSLKKYILPDSDPNASFVIYLDGIQGDGVVNSTTGDLLKWDRAVKNHTLLSATTQAEMLKGQALVDTLKKSQYGFGVFLEKTELGDIVSHSGGWPGYTTFLARNTAKDQTYIILSNNNSNSPAICGTLQQIMAGNPVVQPYAHTAISLDSTVLDLFTGTYKTPDEVKLERRGQKLFRVRPDGQSAELKPESASKFFYADGSDRQLEFELDGNKKIKKAWLIVLGKRTEITRIQ